MAKIEVFNFRVYDIIADGRKVPKRKSTAKRIERVKGEILTDSGELVDAAEIDEDGKHVGTEGRK